MDNYFSIANNILTGSLRPWLKENQDEEKFRHLLSHKLRQNKDNPSEFCSSVINAFSSLNYATENENLEEFKELAKVKTPEPNSIVIPQFYNKQTEFYSYLISNTFQCLLSGVIETINGSDEIDATYKLYQIIGKLESLVAILSKEKHVEKATKLIIDTLSLYIFALHYTLVTKFNSHINFEILSNNELLYQFCPELELQKDDKSKWAYYLNLFISTEKKESGAIQDSNSTQSITVEPQETHKSAFTPILDDNRPSKKGVCSFHDLIKNPQRFASFEEKLFQNDYITAKYAYCGKQGYKNQLAIIYHLIIEKKYFNNFNDSDKKKVANRDIVKFLNHRYDVDIDKQFRSFKNKPEERAKFIESEYWLSQIPMC